MKINFHNCDNDSEDTLVIIFNDSIISECIEITSDFIVGIDFNNKLVNIEVLNYSRNRQWADDLLKDNNLSLNEDSVVFFLHQGYITAWFDIKDIKEEYTVCKYYLEGESIKYDLVKNYIQDEIDIIVRHRRKFVDSKYINIISDKTALYYK